MSGGELARPPPRPPANDDAQPPPESTAPFSWKKYVGMFVGFQVANLFYMVWKQRTILYQRPESGDIITEVTRFGGLKVRVPPTSKYDFDSVALHFSAVAENLTLVYFHGNADQIGEGPSRIGLNFVKIYGVGFYGIEYPGYGVAPGEPTEDSIIASSEILMEHLVSPTGLGVPSNRLVLFGQSLGCAVAVEMARRGWGTHLILTAPFSSILGMGLQQFPFLYALPETWCLYLVQDKWDNLHKVPDIHHPTLVIHGEYDDVVPIDMSRDLADRMPLSRFVPIQRCGHNDIWEFQHGTMTLIIEYLNETKKLGHLGFEKRKAEKANVEQANKGDTGKTEL